MEQAFPRDVLSLIKSYPGNLSCCDCNNTLDTDWGNINHGTLHCLDCAGKHRSLGVNVSFMRSLHMDTWSTFQIEMMKQGGNGQLQQYLMSHNVLKQPYSNNNNNNNNTQQRHITSIYLSTAAERYRHFLKDRVNRILAGEVSTPSSTLSSSPKTPATTKHTNNANSPHLQQEKQRQQRLQLLQSSRARYDCIFGDGPLGLTISRDAEDDIAVVTKIALNGQAQHKGVCVGDAVVAVEDIDLSDYQSVLREITSSPRPLLITFARIATATTTVGAALAPTMPLTIPTPARSLSVTLRIPKVPSITSISSDNNNSNKSSPRKKSPRPPRHPSIDGNNNNNKYLNSSSMLVDEEGVVEAVLSLRGKSPFLDDVGSTVSNRSCNNSLDYSNNDNNNNSNNSFSPRFLNTFNGLSINSNSNSLEGSGRQRLHSNNNNNSLINSIVEALANDSDDSDDGNNSDINNNNHKNNNRGNDFSCKAFPLKERMILTNNNNNNNINIDEVMLSISEAIASSKQEQQQQQQITILDDVIVGDIPVDVAADNGNGNSEEYNSTDEDEDEEAVLLLVSHHNSNEQKQQQQGFGSNNNNGGALARLHRHVDVLNFNNDNNNSINASDKTYDDKDVSLQRLEEATLEVGMKVKVLVGCHSQQQQQQQQGPRAVWRSAVIVHINGDETLQLQLRNNNNDDGALLTHVSLHRVAITERQFQQQRQQRHQQSLEMALAMADDEEEGNSDSNTKNNNNNDDSFTGFFNNNNNNRTRHHSNNDSHDHYRNNTSNSHHHHHHHHYLQEQQQVQRSLLRTVDFRVSFDARPFGMTINNSNNNNNMNSNSIVVSRVVEGGRAERLGVLIDDVVVGVNDVWIDTVDNALQLLLLSPLPVTVVFRRHSYEDRTTTTTATTI